MPVVFAVLDEDAVAEAEDLNRPTATLAKSSALARGVTQLVRAAAGRHASELVAVVELEHDARRVLAEPPVGGRSSSDEVYVQNVPVMSAVEVVVGGGNETRSGGWVGSTIPARGHRESHVVSRYGIVRRPSGAPTRPERLPSSATTSERCGWRATA
jgi:hypothetical protein